MFEQNRIAAIAHHQVITAFKTIDGTMTSRTLHFLLGQGLIYLFDDASINTDTNAGIFCLHVDFSSSANAKDFYLSPSKCFSNRPSLDLLGGQLMMKACVLMPASWIRFKIGQRQLALDLSWELDRCSSSCFRQGPKLLLLAVLFLWKKPRVESHGEELYYFSDVCILRCGDLIGMGSELKDVRIARFQFARFNSAQRH